jgi:hypothetical protein
VTPPLGLDGAGVLEVARATRGFMPDEEGLALARLAGLVDRARPRPSLGVIVEVGSYCGRSTLYLAAGLLGAASPEEPPSEARGRTLVFSVDHHHGSEENQAGWEHHDADLVDPATGRLDTLPRWRAAIGTAGVEDLVVAVVGDSPAVAARWTTPADLVFIDGGHGEEPAWADYRGWAPLVADGGYLAIHDVFPDPADGGRPPYDLYCRAIASGAFAEEAQLSRGSLRVLKRIGPGI